MAEEEKELYQKKCIPCEGGAMPMAHADAEKLLKRLDDWMLVDDAKLLAKTFHFKDFQASMKFVNEVARLAEAEGHHPDITIFYDTVSLELSTHAIGGLSENDFILASKIDRIDLPK